MVKTLIRRFIDKSVNKYLFDEKNIFREVSAYLSKLPDKDIARIIGALGLTEDIYKRLIDTATGERHVMIYFNDGSTVEITNRKDQTRQAVGW